MACDREEQGRHERSRAASGGAQGVGGGHHRWEPRLSRGGPAGNFKRQEELAELQRRSNDDHLGIIRAAVSRSYIVAPQPIRSGP